MPLIQTFFKEDNSNARAEVCEDTSGGYYIDYYDMGGHKVRTEQFPNRSVHYVLDAADNWTTGIKVLNG